ncbi:monooxygenase [Roseovarius dicentrarchi]|uniref:monooxygenase n=1 Tax=Roseovarius dicentrarchi TaxID=2250573 RepID=UPI000DEBFB2C|nr:monooxygenase [Roseovarius dicentrarchi]
MLIAIVQIPGLERSEEDAIASARTSAPTFSHMPGLTRKYFLNGENGGGGVYIWESREQADAWYTPEWANKIKERFGAAPTLTYYDNYVVLDNIANTFSVNGTDEPLD